MTSTTHRGDYFLRAPARRARWRGTLRRPAARAVLSQALVPLAAVGVLVLLLQRHGLSWLGGMVAGASATVWLLSVRTDATAIDAAPAQDGGEVGTREQLALMEAAGWRAVHDVEARFGHYQHVAAGPGGVLSLHSVHLEHPRDPADPASQRELVLLRRAALTAAANLRDELREVVERPAWVQAVVVVWSEFPAGCVQDGRCVFISGARLTDWLRRRPAQLDAGRVQEIATALDGLGLGLGHAAAA